MNYVYQPFQNRLGCATVGFYDPSGAWIPESDHLTNEQAADRIDLSWSLYRNNRGA